MPQYVESTLFCVRFFSLNWSLADQLTLLSKQLYLNSHIKTQKNWKTSYIYEWLLWLPAGNQ